MDNKYLKYLMEMYLNEKRSLSEKKEAFEYEEIKGIFSGFYLDSLRRAYEESKLLIKLLEKYLNGLCPSLEELKVDLGF